MMNNRVTFQKSPSESETKVFSSWDELQKEVFNFLDPNEEKSIRQFNTKLATIVSIKDVLYPRVTIEEVY